jgi:hypothetical protein
VCLCVLETSWMTSHTKSIVIELKIGDVSLDYLLHAITSDRQTRLLNVFGQIAMFRERLKKNSNIQNDQKVSVHFTYVL